MTLFGLAARNAFRNPFRTSLTVLGVAIAILAFVLLRTVIVSWNAAADFAAKDRIATRHKVSFVVTLPRRYVDTIREVKGVKQVTWMNWFGGKDPRNPDNFFANFIVDPKTTKWWCPSPSACIGSRIARAFWWGPRSPVIWA
jgi:putative ABC transport system permease protein